MWTIMNRSVSSTFVTVWAIKPNCFLRNVSMSTSILLLCRADTTALKELDESGIHTVHFTRKSLHQRHFNFNYTFGTGAENRLLYPNKNRGPNLFLDVEEIHEPGQQKKTIWSVSCCEGAPGGKQNWTNRRLMIDGLLSWTAALNSSRIHLMGGQ
jgi:hypothetical protein